MIMNVAGSHLDVAMEKAVTGFEPVIEVLQTCALPLGYTAEMLLFEKTGLAGFEPTNDRVKVCCLTAWR